MTLGFVPRTNEGQSLGTVLKKWLKLWAKDVFVSGVITDGVSSVSVADLTLQNKDFIDLVPQSPKPAWQEGRFFYDDAEGAFGMYTDFSDVTLQVGFENWVRVRNVTGQTIPNGSVVYVNGVSANLPSIALAKADAIATSRILGVTTTDVLDISEGIVTTFGVVHDINTFGMTPGNPIYLSDTVAGTFTETAPSRAVKVGFIKTALALGDVLVIPENAFSLRSLADIQDVLPTTGQILRYNTVSGLWEVKNPALSSVSSGSTVVADNTQTTLVTVAGYADNEAPKAAIGVRDDLALRIFEGDATGAISVGQVVFHIAKTINNGEYSLVVKQRAVVPVTIDWIVYKAIV